MWYRDYCMQYSAAGVVLIVQVIYRLLHAAQFKWPCIKVSRDIQYTACSTVQLGVYSCFKWNTDYCLQYSETSGVLMVQVIYSILHAVHCKLRCMDGSCVIQIIACNTVQHKLYWWFKWYTVYYMQYIANGGELIVQVIYRFLHAVCRAFHLPVYWWLKWYRVYCIKYSATGGVLIVQVVYRKVHAV